MYIFHRKLLLLLDNFDSGRGEPPSFDDKRTSKGGNRGIFLSSCLKISLRNISVEPFPQQQFLVLSKYVSMNGRSCLQLNLETFCLCLALEAKNRFETTSFNPTLVFIEIVLSTDPKYILY